MPAPPHGRQIVDPTSTVSNALVRPGRAVLLCLACFAGANDAQTLADTGTPPSNAPGAPTHELEVARLVYEHGPRSSWGPGRAWWRIDWPEAEAHFLDGVRRYTGIDVAADSVHVSLLEDEVFDYPWLFAQQPGRWGLSRTETDRLGEYLERGGFLVVDDFHGPADWAVFAEAIGRALPGRPIVDLAEDDVLEVLYAIDGRTQIPGRRHLVSGAGGGVEVRMSYGPPRWRGIRDADEHLVVAINFNMDMGDAWEHADDPAYPVAMTGFAYRVGINYLVYAMTH